MTGKKAVTATVTLGLAVVAAIVLAEAGAAGENRSTMGTPPYQVLSGQIVGGFEALYVLDTAKGRLAVLKFEVTKDSLVPVAGRELAKDFGTKGPGSYSMTTVQLTSIRGLLYVTDQFAHKAIAYKVDIIQNTITPMTPIDLNTIFAGP
jgi:hypothetical protein